MLLTAFVRVEVRRHERTGFLGVTVDVGDQGQDRGRVIPGGPALGLGHDHEFVEGEGAGVDSNDPGKFGSEAIHRAASAAGSILSSTLPA